MINNNIKRTGTATYTCNEYRQEMILAGLRKQLATSNLTPDEREKLLAEIEKLEQEMGF